MRAKLGAAGAWEVSVEGQKVSQMHLRSPRPLATRPPHGTGLSQQAQRLQKKRDFSDIWISTFSPSSSPHSLVKPLPAYPGSEKGRLLPVIPS